MQVLSHASGWRVITLGEIFWFSILLEWNRRHVFNAALKIVKIPNTKFKEITVDKSCLCLGVVLYDVTAIYDVIDDMDKR